VWQDGPLTTAVRHGAMCYLDEVVEARQDTTVVIHPLTDNRRMLPLDRKGELVAARPDFLLVVSYNPGYQSAVKDLKESTKQRFVATDFTYPAHAAEASIVAREAAIDARTAAALVGVAASTRNLRGRGLNEGASTRMIVHAGRLIAAGISTNEALRASVVLPLTDDPDTREALEAVIAACTARARPASSPATPRLRTSTWCISWCAIGRRYGPAWRGATRRLLTSGPARPWSCRGSLSGVNAEPACVTAFWQAGAAAGPERLRLVSADGYAAADVYGFAGARAALACLEALPAAIRLTAGAPRHCPPGGAA